MDSRAERNIRLIEPIQGELMRFRLAEGCYWMMGDNQPSSGDSRIFGAVRRDKLVGRAVATFWPPSRWGRIRGRD